MLSDGGKKILFNKMNEFYSSLNSTNKQYFNSVLNAPCPRSNTTINKIYFWKFIKQFLCGSTNRPRNKSPLLLRNIPNVSRNRGANPTAQVSRILKHIGFTDQDFYVNYSFDNRRRTPFVILTSSEFRNISNSEYILICANINMYAGNYTHAVTGYIKNGKGYLFDSATDKNVECDWWTGDLYKGITKLKNAHGRFKNAEYVTAQFNYTVFARKSFVNGVTISCRAATPARMQNSPVKARPPNRAQEFRRMIALAYGTQKGKSWISHVKQAPIIRFKNQANINMFRNMLLGEALFYRQLVNAKGPQKFNVHPNKNYYLLGSTFVNTKLVPYKNWKTVFPMTRQEYNTSNARGLANKNKLNKILNGKS